MRDLIVFIIVLGGVPFILRAPWIGVMYWVWISLMNPHRLAYGFAYDFPFGQLIALATMIGVLVTRDPRTMKGGAAATVLLLFILHTCVTTALALVPSDALEMLERVLKIHLLTFIALLTLHKKQHVLALAWVMVISLGFYSVKGGLFTVATLGNHRVWGPAESFIEENNALALATVMTIPLMLYLFVIYRDRFWRWGLLGAVALSAASALGSHSRGALIAMSAMTVFLWLKGRKKLLLGVVLVVLACGLLAFMPDQWANRMRTIGTFEADESAMGRIETWHMMFDIAVDRPIFGAGYEPYTEEVLRRYRPSYDVVRQAHSVYFQVLGEHGFVGFAFYLLFWLLTWIMARWIIRATNGRPQEQWAFWLARMVQVSLVGYFAGGAFLSLAYWDMPYYLMVALAVSKFVIEQDRVTRTTSAIVGAPPPIQAGLGQAR